VFEIVNNGTAAAPIYASAPTTLVSFDDANGAQPYGSLIADANGDLFGTTAYGGAYDRGTVFEITKNASGYSSVPTIVITFNGSNGGAPFGDLIADANGDLFGTAAIKAGAYGSVFEITGSGFVTKLPPIMLNAIFDPATNTTTLSGSAEANSIVSIYDSGSGTNKLIGTANATELACGEHRSRRYSVDRTLGGAVPSALFSAMICFRHSMPYSVKAGTPSSPTP
jgi:uncharacterized repeat protein (TIGR03803 family)